MAEQMKLFDGVLEYKHLWGLKRHAIDQCAQFVIELFDSGQQYVTEYDIAARKMHLEPDSLILPEQATHFSILVAQIHDERSSIKERVEDLTMYRLVIVGADGNTARMNGGKPSCGFALRGSDAGVNDDYMQMVMTAAGFKSAILRNPNAFPGGENIVNQLYAGLANIRNAAPSHDDGVA